MRKAIRASAATAGGSSEVPPVVSSAPPSAPPAGGALGGRNRQVPRRGHHRLCQIDAITSRICRRRLHHRPGTAKAEAPDDGSRIDGNALFAGNRQEHRDRRERSDCKQYQHTQHPIHQPPNGPDAGERTDTEC
jgi:hypothetical protein